MKRGHILCGTSELTDLCLTDALLGIWVHDDARQTSHDSVLLRSSRVVRKIGIVSHEFPSEQGCCMAEFPEFPVFLQEIRQGT
ncbi:MAG: hypothetical protein RDU20_08335 [Desulfomonilaceae bacterium]|nr:hypothetical protein [Desulfomonilaceae bacterium]